MKKLIPGLVMLLTASLSSAVYSSPVDDIAAFQGFFAERFKDVSLEQYKDGVNALPQYADRRGNWELLLDFPPYEEHVEKGRKEWATPFANGKTFADCAAKWPAATA